MLPPAVAVAADSAPSLSVAPVAAVDAAAKSGASDLSRGPVVASSGAAALLGATLPDAGPASAVNARPGGRGRASQVLSNTLHPLMRGELVAALREVAATAAACTGTAASDSGSSASASMQAAPPLSGSADYGALASAAASDADTQMADSDWQGAFQSGGSSTGTSTSASATHVAPSDDTDGDAFMANADGPLQQLAPPPGIGASAGDAAIGSIAARWDAPPPSPAVANGMATRAGGVAMGRDPFSSASSSASSTPLGRARPAANRWDVQEPAAVAVSGAASDAVGVDAATQSPDAQQLRAGHSGQPLSLSALHAARLAAAAGGGAH